MSYLVVQQFAQAEPTGRWDIVNNAGDRFTAHSRFEADTLAAMLNMLTVDQRYAASVAAIKLYDERNGNAA